LATPEVGFTTVEELLSFRLPKQQNDLPLGHGHRSSNALVVLKLDAMSVNNLAKAVAVSIYTAHAGIFWKFERFKGTRNEGKAFPLRTPDFSLTEKGLELLNNLSPEAYKALYEKYRLDELFALVAERGPAAKHYKEAYPEG
jgi:hypothetical protein